MTLSRIVLWMLFLSGVACAGRTAPADLPGDAQPLQTATLEVRVLGLQSETGRVAVALYDSAESFKERSGAVAAGRVDPRQGTATWTAESIEPGVYAIAAYHDLNENGKLDRSALGAPSEPYGFSNDARGRLGPPKFEKAAFQIEAGDRTIEITLR